MEFIFEFIEFIFYSGLIVIISKYYLVTILRRLAESLNLKPKTVGNIAGIATSVPEFLTVSFSAITGLISASSYNILSSNVINLIQYLIAIFKNHNQKFLQNRALKIDLVIIAFTILIPIFLFIAKIDYAVNLIPMFFLLFALCYTINNHSHKLYLKITTSIDKEIEEETKWVKGKKKIIVKNSLLLLIISIFLYIIGNLLSSTLQNLCVTFNMPQFIIGILLGFITSIPELITFFEAQKYHKNDENPQIGVIEATNNLLTSNVLNLFIIQSIGILLFYVLHS